MTLNGQNVYTILKSNSLGVQHSAAVRLTNFWKTSASILTKVTHERTDGQAELTWMVVRCPAQGGKRCI